MLKTVYLWGAGVSEGTVPMVSQTLGALQKMEEEMIEVRDDLGDSKLGLQEVPAQRVIDGWLELAGELSALLSSKEHKETQDEWAKRLHAQDQGKFHRFCELLSVFYPWVQRGKQESPRISKWVSNMVDGESNLLPQHSAILSWNYDWQLELTLSRLQDRNARLTPNPNAARILRKWDLDVPGKDLNNSFKMNVFKLNGDAFWLHPKLAGFSEIFLGSLDEELSKVDYWNRVVFQYMKSKQTQEHPICGLSFVFDRLEKTTEYFEKIEGFIKPATSLVMAGYSLPDANSAWDRRIIGAFADLKQVVIYDLEENETSLRNKFQAYLRLASSSSNPIIEFRPVGMKPYNPMPFFPMS